MIPVLSVSDTQGARAELTRLFGFAEAGQGLMALGDQQILVTDAPPEGMIPLRLDHLALRVGDADAAAADVSAKGGRFSGGFTPEGPQEIPQFWDRGMRYVFFDGPEGWPFEFCARIGTAQVPPGHDHYGVRTPDPDAMEARLAAMGATRVAAHELPGTPPVRVRFLGLGQDLFEVFDLGPFPEPDPARGFVGLMPD